MASIEITAEIDEKAWEDLRALASESHQSIFGLLTEAIRDYVRRRRIRPEVLRHLESSIEENDELGRLLAE
jgi:predicted transcriptional regulator